jgi:hypothetical protein
MLIPDEFIEAKADNYARCVIKPHKTFALFIEYQWWLFQRENIMKLNKMRGIRGF